MKRYGEGIRRVLASFGPVPDFSGEGAKSIFKVSLILKWCDGTCVNPPIKVKFVLLKLNSSCIFSCGMVSLECGHVRTPQGKAKYRYYKSGKLTILSGSIYR